MTQDEKWFEQFREIMNYMRRYKRRPSKHHKEDAKMHNWIKYNKKLLAKGELSYAREWRFKRLLALAAYYRRLNQYAYLEDEDEAR